MKDHNQQQPTENMVFSGEREMVYQVYETGRVLKRGGR
jgi:hypothetical protein